MPIVPDTKNWTWVIERMCPECGFNARAIAYDRIPQQLRDNAAAWPAVLLRADVRIRPDENTWSALEYAAHVRGVFRLFRVRLELMLAEEDPRFDDWDQDATALAERYNEQAPAAVSAELLEASTAAAEAFANVQARDRARTGRRSDGASFTVDSFARYFAHDPVHHLWDVTNR